MNGDAVVVRQWGSSVLVSLVDALGHGPKAADVARSASEYLAVVEPSTIQELVNGLHGALRGTRGAAALLLQISKKELVTCSVGNVELRSTDATLPFVLTPGVLGVRLRQPKICAAKASTHRIVLFSDGISGRFELRSLAGHSPDAIAKHIFASHRHAHDDASVVVLDIL